MVYGNIYIDECKVLGASYLREISSVQIFPGNFKDTDTDGRTMY